MMNLGFSELVEHEQAILAQISSFNKLQITNKQFAYFILRQIWGQSFGTKLSGVHKSNGQTIGQQVNSGRRGVVRT